MDDTDGPKHCGERRAHHPHEYAVYVPEADEDSFLWSCDGSAQAAPAQDSGVAEVKLYATDISTTFGKVDGQDCFMVVIARTWLVPVEIADGGHAATVLALGKDGRR